MIGRYMQLSDLDSKRIAVLLSGGVDSSVVVYEFAKLGLHPELMDVKSMAGNYLIYLAMALAICIVTMQF